MKEWVDGYERTEIPGQIAGSFVDGPWRHVLHQTQGSNIDLATYAKTKDVPHFTIHPKTKRKLQHISIAKSCGALMNKAGGVETNKLHAIQTEIVGFSKDSPSLSDEELKFIADHLIAVRDAGVPYQYVGPNKPWIGSPDGSGASGVNSSTRLSFDEWNAFNGICGHQHVPENDHWDPGSLNFDKILSFINGNIPAVITPPKNVKEEDMPAIIVTSPGKPYFGVGPVDPKTGRSPHWFIAESDLPRIQVECDLGFYVKGPDGKPVVKNLDLASYALVTA